MLSPVVFVIPFVLSIWQIESGTWTYGFQMLTVLFLSVPLLIYVLVLTLKGVKRGVNSSSCDALYCLKVPARSLSVHHKDPCCLLVVCCTVLASLLLCLPPLYKSSYRTPRCGRTTKPLHTSQTKSNSMQSRVQITTCGSSTSFTTFALFRIFCGR